MKYLLTVAIFLAVSVSSFAVVGSNTTPSPTETIEQVINKKTLRKEKRANRKALRKALWAQIKSDGGQGEKKTGVVAFILAAVAFGSLLLSIVGSIGSLLFFPFLIASFVLGIIAVVKKRQTGFGIAAIVLSGALLVGMVLLIAFSLNGI